MSITQPIPRIPSSGNLGCPYCNAALPPSATFCSACGERIDTKGVEQQRTSPANEGDLSTQYRITSLVRRRPYVNLFFGIDGRKSGVNARNTLEGSSRKEERSTIDASTENAESKENAAGKDEEREPRDTSQSVSARQRMVAIRDIDISCLDDEGQARAVETVRQEYDLLRRSPLHSIMPVIDQRQSPGHLFTITGWPSLFNREGEGKNEDKSSRLHTLQDLLQSGLGLPDEHIALNWMNSLCQALDKLHSARIVVSDLDPYTIIFNKNSYDSSPVLMVSWIPSELRELLPPCPPMTHMSYFTAPEALLGKAEPRSDIYSLGAVLYLLLTGMAPDIDRSGVHGEEEPADDGEALINLSSAEGARAGRRLRSPRELNSRISTGLDECVMRALATDPEERFPSARAMAIALLRSREQSRAKFSKTPSTKVQNDNEQDENVDTVRIEPLSQKNLKRWQSGRNQSDFYRGLSKGQIPHRPRMQTNIAENVAEGMLIDRAINMMPTQEPVVEESIAQEIMGKEQEGRRYTGSDFAPNQQAISDLYELGSGTSTTGTQEEQDWHNKNSEALDLSLQQGKKPSFWQRIINLLQGRLETSNGGNHLALLPPLHDRMPRGGYLNSENVAASGGAQGISLEADTSQDKRASSSFFKQIQSIVLGEQRQTVAAAIIETPLRVQPNQSYTLRIHVIGRDEPGDQTALGRGEEPVGLSAHTYGDVVHIEVRSALQGRNESGPYAYIIQQADVTIPERGYVAEVTVPLNALPTGSGGRRERLHIFFLDEMHSPLYEKPFAVELFVSPLVQPGREGHNVLTIPF